MPGETSHCRHRVARGRASACARPAGFALAVSLSIGIAPVNAQDGFDPALPRQVEVIRTAYGVPHIYADNLRALGYALGHLQVEDYGERVPRGLLRARGELAVREGWSALDSDFASRSSYARAVETYERLHQDTRAVYEGFASGVNRYMTQHPEEFADWATSPFTGHDVAALYVYRPSAGLDVGTLDPASVTAALELLERWDNSAAPDSRGGVLFERWWSRYTETLEAAADPAVDNGEVELFAVPWSSEAPTDTPRGLADPTLAARAFPLALAETVERFGASDVAWGDVHRVRRGDVDVPVGGCAGRLGCFRVINFRDDEDGRRRAVGGDGWVLGVEFTSPPRAVSVLAYGQSSREDSPNHSDQAAMFARGETKEVVLIREDVERAAVRRYRPGLN
jgi:acyl-homoserine lactone acylase PvdQ